jgi:CRP/FNR family transcriptional regulator, cyclic AMP receptor protein
VGKRAQASFDPKTFLAEVGDGKTMFTYLKNEVVFSQGDSADAVFYIQKGNVKLTVISKQGKEAVIAMLGPGCFFGEGCLNGHPLRVATASTIDGCEITRVEKATMNCYHSRQGELFRNVHVAPVDPEWSDRRGLDRSTVQLE